LAYAHRNAERPNDVADHVHPSLRRGAAAPIHDEDSARIHEAHVGRLPHNIADSYRESKAPQHQFKAQTLPDRRQARFRTSQQSGEMWVMREIDSSRKRRLPHILEGNLNLALAIIHAASRLIHHAAYVAALVIPGTSRQRCSRAKAFATKAGETAKAHAPAVFALLVNGVFLFLLGSVTIRQERERDPDVMTATLDTEGFFTKPILPERPSGGGGGGGQAINAALAQAIAAPTVNVAIPNNVLTAITTTAPAVFEVPTMVSSVTDLAAKAMDMKPAGGTGEGQGNGTGIGIGIGIGTGNGSGQGTGSGTGVGSGQGSGQGAGIGQGTGEINGKITTVIWSGTTAEGRAPGKIKEITKSLRRAGSTFVKARGVTSAKDFAPASEIFEPLIMKALQDGQKVIILVQDFMEDWDGYDGMMLEWTKRSTVSPETRRKETEELYARIEDAMHKAGASLHIMSSSAGPVPPLREAVIRLRGSFTVDDKTFSYPNYDGENLMYYKPFGRTAELRVVGPVGPRTLPPEEKLPSALNPENSGFNIPEMRLSP
jgi:hypothetical protein